MITNERQFRISKKKLVDLESELVGAPAPGDASDDEFARMARSALVGTVARMREEIGAYEALSSGSFGPIEIRSLEDLPEALIRARIARALSQADLASLLGLKEQQIQRYEASRYASANLRRVLEIARVLGLSSAPIAVEGR
ncbi:MAG: helix-turn-helix transcriptional regulator [Dehalococcoidia bacterium]